MVLALAIESTVIFLLQISVFVTCAKVDGLDLQQMVCAFCGNAHAILGRWPKSVVCCASTR